MEKDIPQIVRDRAEGRCEYCHFPEEQAELPFHLDHIIAQQHGGQWLLDNLALACCYCNRYKGPNLSSIDPDSGNIVTLFHPRQQTWEAHFSWRGAHLIGSTATGRATVELLQINRTDALAVRGLLMQEGTFTPPPRWLHDK